MPHERAKSLSADPLGFRERTGRQAGRAVATLSRIAVPLTILMVLAGLAQTIRSVLEGRLSGSRLTQAIASFGDSALDFLASGIGLAVLAFAVGGCAGWFAAVAWIGRRLRARSLLLLDPKRADMSFVEGIDHIRAQSGSPRPEVHQAATSIVEAAARGRLSLWQRSGTNVLRRVPPRQIRQAGTRLAIFAGESRSEERPGGVEFRLFRNEVESLWPTRRQLTIGDGGARAPDWTGMIPSVANGLRRTAEKFTKLK